MKTQSTLTIGAFAALALFATSLPALAGHPRYVAPSCGVRPVVVHQPRVIYHQPVYRTGCTTVTQTSYSNYGGYHHSRSTYCPPPVRVIHPRPVYRQPVFHAPVIHPHRGVVVGGGYHSGGGCAPRSGGNVWFRF
jgi:hypothetical protein